MPTIITHPAIAVVLAAWIRRLPKAVIAAALIGTVVPDLDVAGFALGIPYGHPLGHRGFTHSLLFAALFAAAASAIVRSRSEIPFQKAWLVIFAATASHGLLDALTNGGRGVGFFIPFSNERFFFPITPIRVSPIGIANFAEKARVVLLSEMKWVWLPCAIVSAIGVVRRRRLTANR